MVFKNVNRGVQAWRSLNATIEEIIARIFFGNGQLPALVGSSSQLPKPSAEEFDLKKILDNGFVWCPTPKKRTSAERKLTKKFLDLPNNMIYKYSKPKTNIITCLDCGGYHEKGTLCGKCYEKVKAETKAVQDQIFKNDEFRYNYPNKEIELKYENDSVAEEKSEKKILVEIPRKRPEWFDSNLMSKIGSNK